MEHLIKLSPSHLTLMDGSPLRRVPDYSEKLAFKTHLELPHFLNVLNNGTCTVIIPRGLALEIGDTIMDEYNWSAMLAEVIERRPARGDWGTEENVRLKRLEAGVQGTLQGKLPEKIPYVVQGSSTGGAEDS